MAPFECSSRLLVSSHPLRLGLVEALFGAMDHSAKLANDGPAIPEFTGKLRKAVHSLMVTARDGRRGRHNRT